MQAFFMCHADSCATADGDHFKYFVYEEVYFNPVNTKLTQYISMCFASSVNQMGQTAMTHLCNKEVFGKTTKDLTDSPSN
jgi:hypothetical protein